MHSTKEPTVENLLHNIQSLSSAIIVSVNDALVRAVEESDEVPGGEKDADKKSAAKSRTSSAKKNSSDLHSELVTLRREQQLNDTAAMLSIKALHPKDVDHVVQQFSEQQMRRRHRVRDARVLRVPYNALLENVSQTLHVDPDLLKAKIELESCVLPADTPTPAESGRRDEESSSRKAHRYAVNSAGVVYSIDLMRHQLACGTQADPQSNRNLSLPFDKASELKSFSLNEWNPQQWIRGLSGESESERLKHGPHGTSSSSAAAVALEESLASMTTTSILGETGRRRHNRMVRFVEDISVSSLCKTGTADEIAASLQQPASDRAAGDAQEKNAAQEVGEEQSERLMGPTDSSRTQEDEEMLIAFQCGWTVPREVRVARMAFSTKATSFLQGNLSVVQTDKASSTFAPRPSLTETHLVAELEIQRKVAMEDNFSKNPVSIHVSTTWPRRIAAPSAPSGCMSCSGALSADLPSSEPRTKWIAGTLRAKKLQSQREQVEEKESAQDAETKLNSRVPAPQPASGKRAGSVAHSGASNNPEAANAEEAQLEPPASGRELHTYEVDFGLGITPRRQTTRLSTILAAGAAKFQEYLASPRSSHNRKDETLAAPHAGEAEHRGDDAENVSTISDESDDSIFVDVISTAVTPSVAAVDGAERLKRANESLAELRNAPTPFRQRERSHTNSASGKGPSLQDSLVETNSRTLPTSPLAKSGSVVKNRSVDLTSSSTRKQSVVSDGCLPAENSATSLSGSLPPSVTTRTSSVRKKRLSGASPSVRSGGGFHSAERAAARHQSERGEILKAARAASVSHNRSHTQPRSSSSLAPRPPQIPAAGEPARKSIAMEPLEKPSTTHSTHPLVPQASELKENVPSGAGHATPKEKPESAQPIARPLIVETRAENLLTSKGTEEPATQDHKAPVAVASGKASTPKVIPSASHDSSDPPALPPSAGLQPVVASPAPPASGRKVLSGRHTVLKSRVPTNAKRYESPEPMTTQQVAVTTPKTRPISHSANALLRSPHVTHSTKSPQGPTSFSVYAASHSANGEAAHVRDAGEEPSNASQLAWRVSGGRSSDENAGGSARDVHVTDSGRKPAQSSARSRVASVGVIGKKSSGSSSVTPHEKSPSTLALPSTSVTVIPHPTPSSESAPSDNEHTSQARSSARQLTPHSAHTKASSTPHEKPRQPNISSSGIADIQSKKLVSQKAGVAEAPKQISSRIVPAFSQPHEQPQNVASGRLTVVPQNQEVHRMNSSKLGKERTPSTIAPSQEAAPVRSSSAVRRSEALPPPTTVVELRRKQQSEEDAKLSVVDMAEQAPARDTRNMLGYVDPGSVHSSVSSPSKQSSGAKGSIVSWDALISDSSQQLRKRNQGMYSPTGIARRGSISRLVASPHRVPHQDLSGRKTHATPATIQRARSAPRAESIYSRLRAITPARAASVAQQRCASPPQSQPQRRTSPAPGRVKSTQRVSSRRAARGPVSPVPQQRSKTPSQSRPVIRLDGK